MKAHKLIGIVALGLITYAPCAMAQNSSGAASANGPQVTQPEQGGVNWKGVGIGAGTIASNVFYMPAKLAYGILGGIGGGAAYALTGGNKQVANTIWRSSLGGDYIVTPDMLTGKERLHFNGPTSTASPAGNEAPGSATTGAADSSSSYAAASSVPPSAPAPATHSIDRGAGPVTSGNSSKPVGSTKTAPLPDTSIE
jgi:hypothetical protein